MTEEMEKKVNEVAAILVADHIMHSKIMAQMSLELWDNALNTYLLSQPEDFLTGNAEDWTLPGEGNRAIQAFSYETPRKAYALMETVLSNLEHFRQGEIERLLGDCCKEK